jgi:hypothetical protein
MARDAPGIFLLGERETGRGVGQGEAGRTRLAQRGRVGAGEAQRAAVATRVDAAVGMVIAAQVARGVVGGEVRVDERRGERERRREREARAQERPGGSTAAGACATREHGHRLRVGAYLSTNR